MLDPGMSPDAAASRAPLIRIETDRRLGHEWDEWDGKPLPGGGDFSAQPGLFFRFAALTIAALTAAAAALLFLLAPRLADLWAGLPRALWLALGAATGLGWLWFGVLLLSFYGGVRLLPEAWLERGPYPGPVSLTSFVARPLRKPGWGEHAATGVYHGPGERARRTGGQGCRPVRRARSLLQRRID